MEARVWQVEISGGGRFSCREDEFVLTAMQRARCGPIHYGCFGGGCGVCRMKIVEGDYSAERKMSKAHVSERDETDKIALICCIKPRSDLKLSLP